MLNSLIIDDVDIYGTYGIYLKDGGYNGIIQMPQFKASSYTIEEWHEEDGLAADLTAPKFDGRQFNLQFNIDNVDYAERFLDFLKLCSYRQWCFINLDYLVLTLRLVEVPDINDMMSFGTLTLTVADDTYPNLSGSYPIAGTTIPTQGLTIDSHDISWYGVRVLNGTDKSLRSTVKVKPNLTRNISTVAGIMYDNDIVRTKGRDFTVNMLLHVEQGVLFHNLVFMRDYFALFKAITAPNARTITSSSTHLKFTCFYKSSNIKRLVVRETCVWCEFTVTFTVLTREEVNPPVAPFLPGMTVYDSSFDRSFQ